VRIVAAQNEAVDKLEEGGVFKDFPYRDKEKRKKIVKQWLPWMDARISTMTGAHPATKEAFKENIRKQLKEHGSVTPEMEKNIDKGADTMWDGIELAGKKAKELEKPEEDAGSPPSTVNISDEKGESAGSPPPQTREKEKKKKKWPKPIQDWVDKKKAADEADQAKAVTERAYKNGRARTKFFEKSPHYLELVAGLEEAQEKANKPGATQADKDKANQAKEELKKLEGELEKDFQKTPEGQKEFKKVTDAEKAADKARDAEEKAGKNIDSATKEAVQKAEAQGNKQQ